MSKVFNSIRKNFTITPNMLIEDDSISIQARFVFIYMASRPDDWDFYMGHMKKSLGLSEDTIRKYINELCEKGWIIKLGQKKEGGQYGAVSYLLNSEPSFSLSDSSEAEFLGDGEVPAHNKTDFKQNENINKKETISFDVFWNLYDNKKGKFKCKSKWNKLSEKNKEKIIACLPKYISETPDVKYRKHPLSFLNQEIWMDYEDSEIQKVEKPNVWDLKNKIIDGLMTAEEAMEKYNYDFKTNKYL
jgi:hypothetical protein